MSKLSTEDVLKLARLSRLSLVEVEIVSFQNEINEILSYVEVLQTVDVEGLEPTIQVTGLQNVMREDKLVSYQASPEGLLHVAPSCEDTLLKVKRVLQ